MGAVATKDDERQAQAERIQEQLRDILQALSPFTGDVVELEMFSHQPVVWKPVDVKGRVREYQMPGDPPFPLVMDFVRAHDRMMTKLTEMARAKTEGAAQSRRESYALAWEQCLTTFTALLQILQPKLTVKQLTGEFGPSVLENWMMLAIFRLNKAAINRFVQHLYGPTEHPQASPPKANRKMRRRSASRR
jgi:predicted component of type VI protein secretion system